MLNFLGTIDPNGNSVRQKALDFGNFYHIFDILINNLYIRLSLTFVNDAITDVIHIKIFVVFVLLGLVLIFWKILETRIFKNFGF